MKNQPSRNAANPVRTQVQSPAASLVADPTASQVQNPGQVGKPGAVNLRRISGQRPRMKAAASHVANRAASQTHARREEPVAHPPRENPQADGPEKAQRPVVAAKKPIRAALRHLLLTSSCFSILRRAFPTMPDLMGNRMKNNIIPTYRLGVQIRVICAIVGLLFAIGTPVFAADERKILIMGDSLMAWNRSTGRSVAKFLERELGSRVQDRSRVGASIISKTPLFSSAGLSIPLQFRAGRRDWIILNLSLIHI